MVEINEFLPNPTVKQVSFEARFPNLFFIESKIGELQMRVMERFPESALLMRKQMLFTEVGQDGKLVSPPADLDKDFIKKIWQFKSANNYEFNVLTDSLNIQSTHHKTYMKEGADKFRDVIEFVMNNFLEIAKVPLINRIGLRYIDECPIPAKENARFAEWYNTTFPLSRFEIADATEMAFHAVLKKGEYNIRYIEQLQLKHDEYKLKLDFDGFALNIEANRYLSVTDDLYRLIKLEYENTIRDPVLAYMKQEKAK